MNKYKVGNLYLPYKTTNNDIDTFLNRNINISKDNFECTHTIKNNDDIYLTGAYKSNDINVLKLNAGIPSGSCGTDGNYNKICPRYSYCTNTKQCQKILNYLDLANSKNFVYRECTTNKDRFCIKNYFADKGWIRI